MPIGAFRQVGHWTISGCLRDGCRLVHPVRRFIRYIDAIQDVRNCLIHLHFDLSITFIRFSNITFQFHIHFRILFSRIYSIYVLISYTHSHTHFIYSFMHSFHMLGKLPKILDIRVREQTCKNMKRGIEVGRTNPKIFAI